MGKAIQIEVYGSCLFDARSAEEGGADAFQLGGAVEGGSTPSLALIRIVRRAVGLKLNVVIRPIGERRGGVPSGRCTAQEIEAMRYDVRLCREEGVDGIVLGIMDETGGIDLEAMQAVLAEAGDLRATLNHVFDGNLSSMEQAKGLGVHRVYWDGLRWDGRIRLPEEVERLDEHARRLIEAGGDQVAVLADMNVPLEILSDTLERMPLSEIYVHTLVYDDHPFQGNRTVDPRKVKMLRDALDRGRA